MRARKARAASGRSSAKRCAANATETGWRQIWNWPVNKPRELGAQAEAAWRDHAARSCGCHQLVTVDRRNVGKARPGLSSPGMLVAAASGRQYRDPVSKEDFS